MYEMCTLHESSNQFIHQRPCLGSLLGSKSLGHLSSSLRQFRGFGDKASSGSVALIR